jgi:DNA mismatch endonuclease (patch repair protein)
MCRLPATRPVFWRSKIERNRERDRKAVAALTASGWRTLTVWECALRGPARQPDAAIFRGCERFLKAKSTRGELAGNWPRQPGKAKDTGGR